MIIDIWPDYEITDVDRISVFFYPNDGEYRGNMYKDGKAIGDYTAKDSIELENAFPQLTFNWD